MTLVGNRAGRDLYGIGDLGSLRGGDAAHARIAAHSSHRPRHCLRRGKRRQPRHRLPASTGRTCRRRREAAPTACLSSWRAIEDRFADRRRDQRRNDRLLFARTRQESRRRHQQRHGQSRNGARRALVRARNAHSAARRVADRRPGFGHSIKRHFGISSFSTTELTAATIAGLARFESTRGRFDLSRTRRTACSNSPNASKAPRTRRLRRRRSGRAIRCGGFRSTCGARASGKGEAIPVHKFEDDVSSGDRLLFMVPLDQFSH